MLTFLCFSYFEPTLIGHVNENMEIAQTEGNIDFSQNEQRPGFADLF